MSYLGGGAYGEVIVGYCRRTNTKVAIKMLKNIAKSSYDCVKLLREIQLMRKLHECQRAGEFEFIPELIDVIVPKDEDPANPQTLFIIQTHFGIDLR